MISKCSNIVINRTKFSDFEDFDVTTESAEGLKLVGYIETVDMCSGETIKKNVAVEYPSNTVGYERPANYFIYNLVSQSLRTEYIVREVLPLETVTISHRVQGTFEGDFIQINFNENNVNNSNIFSTDENDRKCFNISFARDVEFGRSIKILFSDFPIHVKDTAVCLLDYAKTSEGFGSSPTTWTLFEHDERFEKAKSFLVTFTEINDKTATGDSANSRHMVATNIELID